MAERVRTGARGVAQSRRLTRSRQGAGDISPTDAAHGGEGGAWPDIGVKRLSNDRAGDIGAGTESCDARLLASMRKSGFLPDFSRQPAADPPIMGCDSTQESTKWDNSCARRQTGLAVAIGYARKAQFPARQNRARLPSCLAGPIENP